MTTVYSATVRSAFALLCFFAMTNMAGAHKPSDSFVVVTTSANEVVVQWDIALRDLEFLIGIDSDQDGAITWGEVRAARQAIVASALSRMQIMVNGAPQEIEVRDLLINNHSDGAYVVLDLKVAAVDSGAPIEIDYSFLFDVDPTHRGLVRFDHNGFTSTHVLSPESPHLSLTVEGVSYWRMFGDYVREGVWHIWIGLDHILFLLSLLIPAVLALCNRQWQSVERFKPACQEVLKVVTMFTLAHSITLWLAVMEYVTLPSRLVESTIAFSIVITAVNNVYPFVAMKRWGIAFGFGLIHGFGFANVLLDLGLSDVALGLSLLGFNLGVELGQLAIVVVFLPLAYLARNTVAYRQLVLRAGSVLIAGLGLIWMYERLMNAELLGI